MAAAQVDEKYADASLDKIKALSAVANMAEKTVTAAKARAYEDQAFIEAQEAVHAAYAFRKLTESIYTATDNKAALLSRELTRRVNRNDRDSRANGRFGS